MSITWPSRRSLVVISASVLFITGLLFAIGANAESRSFIDSVKALFGGSATEVAALNETSGEPASYFVNIGTGISQNFDGIGTTATASLPTDWKADKNTTARTLGNYASAVTATEVVDGASVSASATNGIYNMGSGTTDTGSDRAIGFLSSGTATKSGNLYLKITNNTGSTVSGFKISYDVEKYRNGTNAAGYQFQMSYGTDGSTWTSGGSDFLTTFAADADSNGFATAPRSYICSLEQSNLAIYFKWA